MTDATKKKVAELGQQIADLQDDLDDLVEDGDTDDGAFAKHRLEQVLGEYAVLLGGLDAAEKLEVQRSVGLKIEKLKGTASQLKY